MLTCSCLLELGQLLEHRVRLSGVVTLRSPQETRSVCEYGLQFLVAQGLPVLRVYERVTTAVQSHLTVNLSA